MTVLRKPPHDPAYPDEMCGCVSCDEYYRDFHAFAEWWSQNESARLEWCSNAERNARWFLASAQFLRDWRDLCRARERADRELDLQEIYDNNFAIDRAPMPKTITVTVAEYDALKDAARNALALHALPPPVATTPAPAPKPKEPDAEDGTAIRFSLMELD